MSTPIRVHVVAGGFPPGKHAGHDIDYARMRILMALQSNEDVHATSQQRLHRLPQVDRRLPAAWSVTSRAHSRTTTRPV